MSSVDVDRIPFLSPSQAIHLAGSFETNLKHIGRLTGARLTLKGQELWIQGTSEQRQQIHDWVDILRPMWREGTPVTSTDVEKAYQSLMTQQSTQYKQAQSRILARNRKGQSIRPKNHSQSQYVEAIDHHDLCFGIGPAGTGKTYLAAVMAVMALQSSQVERIILTRPAVEAGERLGFLPGDLQEKVDPYLRPLYDALFDLISPEEVTRQIEKGIVEIAPLAYMRGRTLSNAFVILDEAQNTTPEQMKMILTRLGFKSRMVVTGDLTQTDLGYQRLSGLAVAEKVLTQVEGIAFCYFDETDVVRHPLVQRIVAAYTRFESSKLEQRTSGS